MKTTITELMKKFRASAGELMEGLEQIPGDDKRYHDVIEYKNKIQNLLSEWRGLLKKWEEDNTFWPTY